MTKHCFQPIPIYRRRTTLQRSEIVRFNEIVTIQFSNKKKFPVARKRRFYNEVLHQSPPVMKTTPSLDRYLHVTASVEYLLPSTAITQVLLFSVPSAIVLFHNKIPTTNYPELLRSSRLQLFSFISHHQIWVNTQCKRTYMDAHRG